MSTPMNRTATVVCDPTAMDPEHARVTVAWLDERDGKGKSVDVRGIGAYWISRVFDYRAEDIARLTRERDTARSLLAEARGLLERWHNHATHSSGIPTGLLLETAALLASPPVIGVAKCPSHCSFPDTGNVALCPCDPGDCAVCDKARKPPVMGTPPAAPSLDPVAACACGHALHDGYLCNAIIALANVKPFSCGCPGHP